MVLPRHVAHARDGPGHDGAFCLARRWGRWCGVSGRGGAVFVGEAGLGPDLEVRRAVGVGRRWQRRRRGCARKLSFSVRYSRPAGGGAAAHVVGLREGERRTGGVGSNQALLVQAQLVCSDHRPTLLRNAVNGDTGGAARDR